MSQKLVPNKPLIKLFFCHPPAATLIQRLWCDFSNQYRPNAQASVSGGHLGHNFKGNASPLLMHGLFKTGMLAGVRHPCWQVSGWGTCQLSDAWWCLRCLAVYIDPSELSAQPAQPADA